MGEMRPTKISLQLADKTIKYPMGVLNDVPFKIGEFYILVDFVIMDIKEDSEIPIILGSPFLAMNEAIIDVKRGKLTFQVGEEKVEFMLAKLMKNPLTRCSCNLVDIIDICVKESTFENLLIDEF